MKLNIINGFKTTVDPRNIMVVILPSEGSDFPPKGDVIPCMPSDIEPLLPYALDKTEKMAIYLDSQSGLVFDTDAKKYRLKFPKKINDMVTVEPESVIDQRTYSGDYTIITIKKKQRGNWRLLIDPSADPEVYNELENQDPNIPVNIGDDEQ